MSIPLAYHAVGDGPPLLLVHGAAEDAAMLAPQAAAFAALGRRVVTYDRRKAHLAARPEDWAGAFDVMLGVLSEGHADLDSPAVAAQRANAQAALRDDARVITLHSFAPGELPADRITVAVGKGVSPLLAMVAETLESALGRPTLVVDDADEHEIYLTRPEVLAAALAQRWSL